MADCFLVKPLHSYLSHGKKFEYILHGEWITLYDTDLNISRSRVNSAIL